MSDNDYAGKVADRWLRLMKVTGGIRLGGDTNRDLASYTSGMSYRQIDILIILACLDIHTISEIAAYLKVSRSTTSIIVNKLVAKGYVNKERPGELEDGRRTHLVISEKGSQMLENMGEVYIKSLCRLYDRMDEGQKYAFTKGVGLLRAVDDGDNESLFAEVTKRQDMFITYDENLRRIAADIAYFMINVKLEHMGDDNLKLPEGLTPNQLHLLMCITEGGLDSISKLEEHLGASSSTLSIGVSKMVDKGYLIKEYPAIGEDGRKMYIRVTDLGKELTAQACSLIKDKFLEKALQLTEDKLRLVDEACECFLEAFENLNISS